MGMSSEEANRAQQAQHAAMRGATHNQINNPNWMAKYNNTGRVDHGRGSSDSGCFPAGAQVMTPSGPRAIETLTTGERVLSVSPRTGAVTSQQILKRKVHADNVITRIAFEDGASVRTTAVHSFRTTRGWKMARALRPGDQIWRCGEGQRLTMATVQSVVRTEAVETVYNLITEGPHTFIVDGAVVHNFTYFKGVKAVYWALRQAFSVPPVPLRRVEAVLGA